MSEPIKQQVFEGSGSWSLMPRQIEYTPPQPPTLACPRLCLVLQVEALIAPLEAAAAAEVARLEGMERQRAALAAQVADLTRRVANLE